MRRGEGGTRKQALLSDERGEMGLTTISMEAKSNFGDFTETIDRYIYIHK